jgi:hypothetical protein
MPIRYSLGYSTSKPPTGLKGKGYYEYNAESSKTRGTFRGKSLLLRNS